MTANIPFACSLYSLYLSLIIYAWLKKFDTFSITSENANSNNFAIALKILQNSTKNAAIYSAG